MRGSSRQRLYVEEHGEGEPLLLLEGLGQSLWAWREQIPVFARRFLTIGFDTRGTGRSPVPDEPYGIDELAQDAANILDGRRARVVGLSMGGYVALTLAVAQPGLVRSLVLHGDADVIVPVENGRALAARLPNARFVELPGRGHNVQLEDPATVNRLVLEFLER